MTRCPTRWKPRPEPRLAALWQHPGVTVLATSTPSIAPWKPPASACVHADPLGPAGRPPALHAAQPRGRPQAYFIVNNDRHAGLDVDVALQGSGRLEEWDALTGAMRAVPAAPKATADCTSRPTLPPPVRACTWSIPPRRPTSASPVQSPRFNRQCSATGRQDPNTLYRPGQCAFTRTDPNMLTLDKCRYRLGNDDWSEEMDVWRAQKPGAREPGHAPGLLQRPAPALQLGPAAPPCRWRPAGAALHLPVRTVPAHARSTCCWRAPQDFTIHAQRAARPQHLAGWYLDRAFHKRGPAAALRIGLNELILACAYTNYMEIEDCFLLGDFAVSPDREILAEPPRSTLAIGPPRATCTTPAA